MPVTGSNDDDVAIALYVENVCRDVEQLAARQRSNGFPLPLSLCLVVYPDDESFARMHGVLPLVQNATQHRSAIAQICARLRRSLGVTFVTVPYNEQDFQTWCAANHLVADNATLVAWAGYRMSRQ